MIMVPMNIEEAQLQPVQMTAKSYRLTTVSCFVGIFCQAISSNITAILFIPLMTLYGLSYVHLGLLVGINFTTQVLVDIIASRLVDRYGFRVFVLPSDLLAVVGLVLFALSPVLFQQCAGRADPLDHHLLGLLRAAGSDAEPDRQRHPAR